MILTAGVVHSEPALAVAASVKPIETATIASTTSTSTQNAENLTQSNTTTSSTPSTAVKLAPITHITVTPIIHTNDGVEQTVEDFFANTPIMVHIAECESHFTQFETDGSVYRGHVNDKDVGVMQINERWHGKEATADGIDLYTLAGNLEFAKKLYEQKGSEPWISSSPCWGKYSSLAMK